MGFIDSYKHLEKLCGEVLNDDRKISAYIDEMTAKPQAERFVTGWSADLKKLKHYRWVRNQISHEPGCSESNMCTKEDAYWIDNFYKRIMNQTDPLSLYYKTTKPRTSTEKKQVYTPIQPRYTYSAKNPKQKKPIGCFTAFLIIIAVIAVIYAVIRSYNV